MPTKHFSPDSWFDYLRSTLGEKRRQEMEAHLNSGCHFCGASVKFWSHVLRLVDRERHLQEPSAELVAAVTNEIVLPVRALEPKEGFHLGQLIFNSLLQPALAPVRASALAGPQLVFESGHFIIDLQLTAEPGRPHNFLTGQILLDDPANPLPAGIRVALYSGKSNIATVDVSEFGEFDFDVSLRRLLSLQFMIPGQEGIEIHVPDPVGQ